MRLTQITRENSSLAIPARSWNFLFLAWLVALISTLGALYVGEVLGQSPCILCWYQRIAMFPMAVILGIASLRNDYNIWIYILPLSVIGGAIALWHSLLFLGVVSAGIVPCGPGVSCTSSDMTVLGGLPLPLLSLAAFFAITILMYLVKAGGSE